jgi:hypothetical protein
LRLLGDRHSPSAVSFPLTANSINAATPIPAW